MIASDRLDDAHSSILHLANAVVAGKPDPAKVMRFVESVQWLTRPIGVYGLPSPLSILRQELPKQAALADALEAAAGGSLAIGLNLLRDTSPAIPNLGVKLHTSANDADRASRLLIDIAQK